MKIFKSKRNQRKFIPADNSIGRLVAYGVIAVIIMIALAIWGVTLLANLSGFWDTVRGSSAPAPVATQTVVLPPTLRTSSAKTNSRKATLTGSSQPGAVVTLYLLGQTVDSQLVGNDGQFSFSNVTLKEGSNIFTAKAKLSNSESNESNAVTIILDTLPPKLVVDNPGDGVTSTSMFVTAAGHTDPGTTVTINGNQQIVQADGTFNGVVTLTPGTNGITFVALDDAGNKTTVVRTVTYSPQ